MAQLAAAAVGEGEAAVAVESDGRGDGAKVGEGTRVGVEALPLRRRWVTLVRRVLIEEAVGSGGGGVGSGEEGVVVVEGGADDGGVVVAADVVGGVVAPSRNVGDRSLLKHIPQSTTTASQFPIDTALASRCLCRIKSST
ncbi:hypothetical protein AAG570_002047 [Ranatra chinensis]|uniref:Uncharacterized protein n=1 Tax=Ranatra chinensis TaxID=642074 RepID=A0ABD0YAL1_9HEMI